jgi:SPP1 family predicted phage head-tail adaptor
MLKKFLNIAKTRNIKIFKEIEENGKSIKQYIHPYFTSIKAYVRQLSANEMASANAIQDASDIEFTIHKRNIDIGMFVEFNDKIYQINAVDFREFLNADITFRAMQVNRKNYQEIRWSE